MSAEGIASWYSSADACGPRTNNLKGCPTASGKSLYALERDDARFVALNKPWRLGDRVLVTNLVNGRGVIATVEDRGGFGKYGRVADLSKRTFRELADPEDLRRGTMLVAISRLTETSA